MIKLGLSLEKWQSMTEHLTLEARAVAIELLLWTWNRHVPLPADLATVARLARVNHRRTFDRLWRELAAADNRPLFVLGAHGWVSPELEAARGLTEKKQRAGRRSMAVQRQARTAPGVEPAVRIEPQPSEFRTEFFRERPPGPAARFHPSGTEDPAVSPARVEQPISADALSIRHANSLIVRTTADLDAAALALAALVLSDRDGEMGWDPYRDGIVEAIALFYNRGTGPTPKVDRTELTYRAWDESFLGSYRDRFVTTRTGISLTAPRDGPPV